MSYNFLNSQEDDQQPDFEFEEEEELEVPLPEVVEPVVLVDVEVSMPELTAKRGYYVVLVSDPYPVAYLVPHDKAQLVGGKTKLPLSLLVTCPIAKDFGPAISAALPAVEDVLRKLYLHGVTDDAHLDPAAVQRALNLTLPTAGTFIKNA